MSISLEQYLNALQGWSLLMRNLPLLQPSAKFNTTQNFNSQENGNMLSCSLASNKLLDSGQIVRNSIDAAQIFTNSAFNQPNLFSLIPNNPVGDISDGGFDQPPNFSMATSPFFSTKQRSPSMDITAFIKAISSAGFFSDVHNTSNLLENLKYFSDQKKDGILEKEKKPSAEMQIEQKIEQKQSGEERGDMQATEQSATVTPNVIDINALLLSSSLLPQSFLGLQQYPSQALIQANTHGAAPIFSLMESSKRGTRMNPYPKPPYSYIALITMVLLINYY